MTDFTVYPAIDLRGGKAVRLEQGLASKQKVYSENPAAIARFFEGEGATWLHVVNLDGAFGVESGNLSILREICELVAIPVQFGGGLKERASIEQALELGVARVVLGTAALRHPELVAELAPELGEKLAIGIDAKNGKVAVAGWVETTDVVAIELAKRMIDVGVRRFIYTDISRDGMESGPDIDGALEIASLGAKVIASGGVGTLAHISACKAAGGDVEGIIVGRALYEKRFSLSEALAV